MTAALEIRRLSQRDVSGDFSCGSDALDTFVRRYAKQQERREQSATSLAWVDSVLAGFVTILPGSIDASTVVDLVKGLPRQPVPVLVLARMGTDPRFKHLRIGERLLKDVVFAAADELARNLGCIGVRVDAKSGSIGFYERYGFVRLGEADQDPVPMFLAMGTLRAALDPELEVDG